MIRDVPSGLADSFELAAAARLHRSLMVGETVDVAGVWLQTRLKELGQRIGGFTVQSTAFLQRSSLD